MSKVIFHIDMNAYFASVAIASRSDLDNVPVAVSNSLNNTGMILSANYIARSFGVRAAMANSIAYKLCPKLIIVESDFELYKQYTKKIFNVIKEYSPYIEPASIDECYVDMSEVIKKFKRPLDLAVLIQTRLLEEMSIPCSIGIASNKFLAKMASDMKKPLGITILRKNELHDKLWTLPINEMYGIGTKLAAKLIEHHITKIGDLVLEKNYSILKTLLGNQCDSVIEKALGNDKTPLVYNQSVQSISQSKTYINALQDSESVISELKIMIKKICDRAIEKNIFGKHISLILRYENGKSIIRSTTTKQYTQDYNEILEQVLTLFDRHYNNKSVKLAGVGLGSLISKDQKIDQLTVFDANVDYDIKTILNNQLKGNKLIYLKELKYENK